MMRESKEFYVEVHHAHIFGKDNVEYVWNLQNEGEDTVNQVIIHKTHKGRIYTWYGKWLILEAHLNSYRMGCYGVLRIVVSTKFKEMYERW